MTFLVLANLTLAVLLAISGIAKLRAPAATRDAFTALRLPAALRRSPAPTALPWAELALAVVLVFGAGWLLVLGTVGALLLFLAYTAIIARALGFDEPVSCACFGTLGAHDVSKRTLARNLLLVALAALGVWSALAGHTVYDLGWLGWGWVAVAALAAAAVALSLGGAPAVLAAGGHSWIGNAVITERATGAAVQVRRLAARHDGVVLLFVLPGCGGCERVMADLPRDAGRVVVPLMPSDSSADAWGGLGVELYEDPGFNLGRAVSGGASPAALELGRDGVPVGPVAIGFDDVTALIGARPAAPRPESASPEPEPEPAPEAAVEDDVADYQRTPIPDAVLLRPTGEPVTVRRLAAERARLLVAIDCLCAPARESINRLAEWQERLPILEVGLVVPFQLKPGTLTPAQEAVSFYDHEALASSALGLHGKSSAVLLGADGLLAGGPVHGLDEVEAFVADIESQLQGAEADHEL